MPSAKMFAQGVGGFTEMIFKNKRLSNLILPLGDGLAISFRIKFFRVNIECELASFRQYVAPNPVSTDLILDKRHPCAVLYAEYEK